MGCLHSCAAYPIAAEYVLLRLRPLFAPYPPVEFDFEIGDVLIFDCIGDFARVLPLAIASIPLKRKRRMMMM